VADIDLENMEKLIALMVQNDLSELQYEHGELKIELKRGCAQILTAPLTAAVAPSASSPATDASAPTAEDDGLVAIASPMVGTYYSAPDPESAPFISVGTVVDRDTVVCLIEAMKVFNEIKAEVDGTIEKIVTHNEEPVEYGQALFYVRPS